MFANATITTDGFEITSTTDRYNPNKDHENWVNSLFSFWNGSCKDLNKLIENQMNNPRSFDHVETVYVDDKDEEILESVKGILAESNL